MIDKALIFGEVVVLSMALPLSVIAALGFRGSPFRKVMTPIPVTIAAYLIADGSVLFLDSVPAYFYAAFSSVAVLAAAYAAVNAMLLLTERRTV
jgi:hypothetical protein